jgi:hypothetical protein
VEVVGASRPRKIWVMAESTSARQPTQRAAIDKDSTIEKDGEQ